MVHSTSVQAAGMFLEHGTHARAPVPQAAARPWWSGFEDASLDQLMAASRGTAAPGVAAAYIALKVKTLELGYLENTRAAAARQAVLISANPPRHDDFAKELAARQADADTTIGKLKAQRASYISYLAAQCHMPESALSELLADALQDTALPRFSAEVPRGLPMAVLARRSDINLAAALYDADPGAMPDGVIDASGEAQDIDMPDKPLYANAVMQARDQVAGALRHLQMQSDIANTAYRRVADARSDFESSKRRRDRGEISEVQLMEDFQGLLLDLHVLAAANGELALAWVVFMGSIGGDAPVDAVANALDTSATQSMQFPFLHKVSRKLRNP